MDLLINNGTINYYQEFFDAIEIKKQALSGIRAQTQHFTVKHIDLARKKFNVDANFFFDKKITQPFLKRSIKRRGVTNNSKTKLQRKRK